ncbi:MAG TPA: DUF5941 domain-containing protein [Streptosporangiaceae bacterium]|jgi:hypothetical protein|nr:DUF5941 domain-containing protein [Streptosporangiaceae bacterium]
MTVALVLAAEPAAGLCGQLTSLGVRRVDATDDAGSGGGLLAIAAAARATSEPMLICGGDLAVPRQALARLLATPGTAGYAEARDDCRAILIDPADLRVLAEAAEYLAARPAAPDQVSALMGELARRGADVQFVEARPDGDADRDEDGVVAELFADPIARDVAHWAADRALAPAALLGISLGLGLASAIWFSEPIASAKAMAAVTLLAAFVCSRSGRLLARSPGPVLAAIGSLGARAGARAGVIQPAGDWLAAAGWAITECAVYAGLAASAGLGDVSVRGVIGGGPGGVWHLAVLALAVVAIRRMTDLGYERATEDSGGRIRLPRSAARRRLERALTLPAGERALVLIVAGGIWGPRIAFLALIAGGVLAIGYLLTARVVGMRDVRQGEPGDRTDLGPAAPALGGVGMDDGSISLDPSAGPLTLFGALAGSGDGTQPEPDPRLPHADEAGGPADSLLPGGLSRPAAAPRERKPRVATRAESAGSFQIAAYRDDGPISLWLGRLVEGRIPPVPPLIVGLFVTCALAALGMGNLSGVLLLTPVVAMLLGGLGSSHAHDGRLDWLVPALIQVGEYLFLAALAFTHRVAPPLVFALLAAVVLRHLDVAYRARHRIFWPVSRQVRRFSVSFGLTGPPAAAGGRPADVTGLGWEIRMLVLGAGAVLGITPIASVALAAYLWGLLVRDFLTSWLGVHDEPVLARPVGPAGPETRTA